DAAIKKKTFLVEKKSWFYSAYGTATMVVFAVCLWGYHSFAVNKILINTLQIAINNSQRLDAANTQYPHLSALNALHNTLENIQQKPVVWHLFDLPQAKQLIVTAQTTYQQLLQKQFVPALQQILETQLKTIDTNNPIDLYSALKAYLILGDDSHRDNA